MPLYEGKTFSHVQRHAKTALGLAATEMNDCMTFMESSFTSPTNLHIGRKKEQKNCRIRVKCEVKCGAGGCLCEANLAFITAVSCK